jgi:cytochrome c oxidase cbb3-type subunit I
MERFMNPSSSADRLAGSPNVLAQAAWHSLFWLVAANAIGVLLAVLLLFPRLNVFLGEWTYGRWMMVHMNLELYGWSSLPLVGYLFHIYGARRGTIACWCRPVLWVWSAALGVGAVSWLNGHSSGKLFLDWSGDARIFFLAALLALWSLLTITFIARRPSETRTAPWLAKLAGLLALLAVPFALFVASNPNGYPPVNPSTGGPTGASQLESSLAIVLIVLMLPIGIAQTKSSGSRTIAIVWILLAIHAAFCASLGYGDVSHRVPTQWIGFLTILVWLPVVPIYFRAFNWHAEARRWRKALLWWWAALLLTGATMFLPGVLDHFKFTDGLVGHSFVAMAGFASSLIVLVLGQLLGDGAWIFNRPRAFFLWHAAVIAYVVVVTIAGWREGYDPAFTIVPGPERNLLYSLRLVTGIVMLIASVDWLVDSTALLRQSNAVSAVFALEKTA